MLDVHEPEHPVSMAHPSATAGLAQNVNKAYNEALK